MDVDLPKGGLANLMDKNAKPDAVYSFGIELEVILEPDFDKAKQHNIVYKKAQGDTATLAQRKFVAEVLKEALSITPTKVLEPGSGEEEEAKTKGSYYQYWNVIEEPSVTLCPEWVKDVKEKNKAYWSLEIISRVGYTDPTGWKDWERELDDVWKALNSFFNVKYSESTHVHIKQLAPNTTEPLSFEKRVAQFVAYWDIVAYHRMPPARRYTSYALPNFTQGGRNASFTSNGLSRFVAGSDLRGKSEDRYDVTGADGGRNENKKKASTEYKEPLGRIESFPTPKGLALFMGDQKLKYFAWNFNNLWSVNEKPPLGTIEFRRSPGSWAAKDTCHWVTFGLSFVHAAWLSGQDKSKIKDAEKFVHVYEQMMNDNKIPELGPPFMGANVGYINPDQHTALYKFGVGHLDTFDEWMYLAAESLGMQEYLKLKDYTENAKEIDALPENAKEFYYLVATGSRIPYHHT